VQILAYVDNMQNLLVLILAIRKHAVATGFKRLCKLNYVFCVCVCMRVCVCGSSNTEEMSIVCTDTNNLGLYTSRFLFLN